MGRSSLPRDSRSGRTDSVVGAVSGAGVDVDGAIFPILALTVL